MKMLITAAFLFAAAALGAERTAVVVLLPVADAKAPVGMGLAMQEKASVLLMAAGRYDVVHARQVRSMALRHRMSLSDFSDPNTARQAAERLGASLFVYSKVSPAKGGWALDLSVGQRGDPKVTHTVVNLGGADNAAVDAAGKALALAVTQYDGSKAPVGEAQPATAKDAAMRDYEACDARLIEQPVGIETPFVLNDAELKKAMASCESAVKLDPSFSAAWAALAFAAALSGDDARAVEALTSIKPDAGHVPNAMAARFWLVSRYQTPDAAESVLKGCIAKEPGFLLARVYLAELYTALSRYDDAAVAWREYAAHSEGNAFIISRLAYTLARLGKTKDAAAFAEKAMAYDPESYDLALEHSSRLLDDKQVDKALAVLAPLAEKKDAPAELILRFGYAKMVKGDLDGAERLMHQALTLAKPGAEWRTRARAHMNLAELYSKREAKDKAKIAVAEALNDGLRPSAVKPELLKLLSDAEVKAAEAKGLGAVKPKEGSPLPEAGAAAAKAPNGFERVQVNK